MPPQFMDIIGAAVGQGGFGLGPYSFIRIEFRGVRGKGFEMEAWIFAEELPDHLPFVRPTVVPDDDNRAAQMHEEITEKIADLDLGDVVEVEAVIEAEPFSGRADRNAGDDGDAVMELVAVVDRGLAPRGPGLAHGRDQHEARFV
jgi:hypothetical protein